MYDFIGLSSVYPYTLISSMHLRLPMLCKLFIYAMNGQSKYQQKIRKCQITDSILLSVIRYHIYFIRIILLQQLTLISHLRCSLCASSTLNIPTWTRTLTKQSALPIYTTNKGDTLTKSRCDSCPNDLHCLLLVDL